MWKSYTGTDTVIERFVGTYFFISNYYRCKILYRGLTYHCVQDAFYAQQCRDEEDKAYFTKYHPTKSKYMAEMLPNRDDWEEVKERIMYEILYCKFTQNIQLRTRLKATGNKELLYVNTVGDTYWGIHNGEGQNILGKLLMCVRTETQLSCKKRKEYEVGL